MPIIYKAVKDTLEAVNYGIAIGTGRKGGPTWRRIFSAMWLVMLSLEVLIS